jgi:probable addiction module antidote protein
MPMSKKTKSYRAWLTSKLSDPERAARYLNAALEDSEIMFLKALRKVAASQARPMAEIAEACGVSRESVYRMLSENGNPTSENRRAILAALGLKSIVVPIQKARKFVVAESLNSENATAAYGNLKGNPTIVGQRMDRLLAFGSSTALRGQLIDGASRKPANFVSVGYSSKVLQAGGNH